MSVRQPRFPLAPLLLAANVYIYSLSTVRAIFVYMLNKSWYDFVVNVGTPTLSPPHRRLAPQSQCAAALALPSDTIICLAHNNRTYLTATSFLRIVFVDANMRRSWMVNAQRGRFFLHPIRAIRVWVCAISWCLPLVFLHAHTFWPYARVYLFDFTINYGYGNVHADKKRDGSTFPHLSRFTKRAFI